jgi:hypothetical protein
MPQQMGSQQQSAKKLLEQCVQQCEQMKQQMVGQTQQVQNAQARTAFQMAINAVDSCIAQCHTASGVIS